MESVLYFTIPEICNVICDDNSARVKTNPILLLCEQADHCDFINDQILNGNTIIPHLNIDDQGIFGLCLEVNNPSGFIITKDDCEMIRQISISDKVPVISTSYLLTRIMIVITDFLSDLDFIKQVLDSRKKSGCFCVIFGYRMNGKGIIYIDENSELIEFDEYTTVPHEQFTRSIMP